VIRDVQMTMPNMTRQGPVLLLVLTIFMSSLPREHYSVTSCGGMVHIPLLFVFCKPGRNQSLSRLVKFDLHTNSKRTRCLSCMPHGQRALNFDVFFRSKRRLISSPLWNEFQSVSRKQKRESHGRNVLERVNIRGMITYKNCIISNLLQYVSQESVKESIIIFKVYTCG